MGTKTHAINHDEFARYMAILNTATGKQLPYAAVMLVMAGTGARIGEVLALRGCDLFYPDWSPMPEISRSLEKKRGKPVRLSVSFPWDYIGDQVIRWSREARRQFLRKIDEPLFSIQYNHQPIDQDTIRAYSRDILTKAGINWRGVGTHGIRKTFLREVYYRHRADNADMMTALRAVQRLAGHSRFETTLIYLIDEIEGSHRNVVHGVFQTIFPPRLNMQQG